MIRQVRLAVVNAHCMEDMSFSKIGSVLIGCTALASVELGDIEHILERLEGEKHVQEAALQFSELDVQKAEKQYNTILERYNSREAWLSDSVECKSFSWLGPNGYFRV
jgi:hypothetical protein